MDYADPCVIGNYYKHCSYTLPLKIIDIQYDEKIYKIEHPIGIFSFLEAKRFHEDFLKGYVTEIEEDEFLLHAVS